jgi:glucose-1-phosphate thymidylyltransferase
MRGIILAGGNGMRLQPMTQVISKQLLPVYDKPMIYYPLTTLMLAGVREILIISSPRDLPQFQRLLGDGSQFGLTLYYAEQPRPEGLAQAYLIGADFVMGQRSILILGDNIFYGPNLSGVLRSAINGSRGATVFGRQVHDPGRYGVAAFDKLGQITSIVEKPQSPLSNWAITGLYIYDEHAPRIAAGLKPSPRGELEITDLNRAYLACGRLKMEKLGPGFAWFDTGTPDSLIEAAEFVRTVKKQQAVPIACPEEIAFRLGWISSAKIRHLSSAMSQSDYGKYLTRLGGQRTRGRPDLLDLQFPIGTRTALLQEQGPAGAVESRSAQDTVGRKRHLRGLYNGASRKNGA